MTRSQKEKVKQMRDSGDSYAQIAVALNISESTIKSHCRRHNLGAGYVAAPAIMEDGACGTSGICENCGQPLRHTPGSKKKRFCSDHCRMTWWHAHPEAVHRKAIYHFRCKVCGTPFESYGNAHRKYCSVICSRMARRTTR